MCTVRMIPVDAPMMAVMAPMSVHAKIASSLFILFLNLCVCLSIFKKMVKPIRTREDLQQELKRKNTVVVKFYAKWCGACSAFKKPYEDFARRYPSISFLEADVETAKDLSTSAQIQSIPTFIIYRSGVKVQEFAGANVQTLVSMLERYKQ
jgi:thioredoxin 1